MGRPPLTPEERAKRAELKRLLKPKEADGRLRGVRAKRQLEAKAAADAALRDLRTGREEGRIENLNVRDIDVDLPPGFEELGIIDPAGALSEYHPPVKKRDSKPQIWRPMFMEFISNIKILSKESNSGGPEPLVPYGAQTRFLDQVCSGLEHGTRNFVCLKARQLGISTISLAMDLFWLSVYDGVQGALITDDESNREKFRLLLESMLMSLPKGYRIGIKKHNRNNLVLQNDSMLDYIVAGKRKGKPIGVSRALNFLHATEMSNWGDPEAVNSLKATLAQHNPNRLYIWESTARGYNLFWDMWQAAKDDEFTQKAFFIGWWAKELYSIPRDDPRFERYGFNYHLGLTDAEKETTRKVRQMYGHRISIEQWAWYRWQAETQISSEESMKEEFPSTEDEAFVMTGKSFFNLIKVAERLKELTSVRLLFKGFRYHMGENFLATELEQVYSSHEAELKVWEDYVPGATYVIGCDPAYGRSDFKDRHCIQVYRCYADKLIQVAEYATPDCESYQVAWVLAHLGGAYKNVVVNLEINGPGEAVYREMQHLKQLMDQGVMRQAAEEKGLLDVFGSMRSYLYRRTDAIGGMPTAYHWKTTGSNKPVIMNQLRDNFSLGALVVHSIQLLEEMKRVVQDGGEIAGEGASKDDRVFASALANRAWIDWVRGAMIAQGQTLNEVDRQETEKREGKPRVNTMVRHIVGQFFDGLAGDDEPNVVEWSRR